MVMMILDAWWTVVNRHELTIVAAVPPVPRAAGVLGVDVSLEQLAISGGPSG